MTVTSVDARTPVSIVCLPGHGGKGRWSCRWYGDDGGLWTRGLAAVTLVVVRAIIQTEYGVDRLVLREMAAPPCGPGQVLVRVAAAGLSPGDRAMVTGVPYVNRLASGGVRRPKRPIPGFDLAGIVEEVGPTVEGFDAGDRVFGNAPGSFAEIAVATPDQLAFVPEGWSLEAAAAVPESAAVALEAVRDVGGAAAEGQVAIVGAGGGVGSYAVQIATAMGAHVSAICGARMCEEVVALGAGRAIDYRLRDLSPPGCGYDLVVDTAGVTPLRDIRRALAPHGRLVIVGADHGRRVTGGLGRWLRAVAWSPLVSQRLRPFVAGPITPSQLADLTAMMVAGTIRPTIDRTFPLEHIADAMGYLDHRDRPGKVVFTIGR